MPTRFKVFQPKKTDNSPKYRRMKGQKLGMLTVKTSISMHPFANDRAPILPPILPGFPTIPRWAAGWMVPALSPIRWLWGYYLTAEVDALAANCIGFC